MRNLSDRVNAALAAIKHQKANLYSISSEDLESFMPAWRNRTNRILKPFLVSEELKILQSIHDVTYPGSRILLLKALEDIENGLMTMPEHYLVSSDQLNEASSTRSPQTASVDEGISERSADAGTNVFVVHGHDTLAKVELARTLEKLKLTAIVLHEQANEGKTVIEKFERDASRVAFAVILLTPDDAGYPAGKPDDVRPRARQNVLLELGYFSGVLGRSRVCALHKGDVEIPSDYLGVVYVPMDESGAWRFSLVKELKQAGLPVDLNSLV